ncbi:MAG: nucleotidyltransferase domain-containing protein [Planctomycetota bacterium]|nr:nucleotidyltransferase domain-containing protein [Planctomycetota bacterium]
MIPLVAQNAAEIERLCRAHGVARLYLIGSAADDTFDPSRSDVDFLVEFLPQPRKGFDDVYFLLHEELERLLGRKVDLIERGCIPNPVVRSSIERTKVPLYAAA